MITPYASQLSGLNNIYDGGNRLSRSIERLSSGLRINHGSDDPAGLGLSSVYKSQKSGSEVALLNTLEALDMLGSIHSGLNTIEDLVILGRDKVVRAYNEATLSTADKELLQTEIDGILRAIDDIANGAKFGDKFILNSSNSDTLRIDSQAELMNGYSENPVGSIDLLSSPGDIKLDTVAWANSVGTRYTQAAGGDNYSTVYLDNVVDNGDGTHNARVYVEINSTNNRNFNGSIDFDASTTINAWGGPGGVAQAGNSMTYNFTAGPGGTKTFWADITADNDASWAFDLNNPSSAPGVSLYYDNVKLYGPKLGAWSVPNNYFTTIEPVGEYYSGPMDMEAAGGTASLTWSASQPGGTTLNVRLQESATGAGGWTDLPMLQSGETFDYSQRYIRAVVEMTSAGITFGSPSVDWIEVKKVEPIIVHAGPDNADSERIRITSIDARSAALGISSVSVIQNTSIVAQYDSSLEMLTGFTNLNNIDILSDPGFYQLESPIAGSGTINGTGQNYFTMDYTVTATNTDGTYDIEVNLNTYGKSMSGDAGLYFFGNIYFMDAEGGPVPIASVAPISHEGGGNWADSFVANGAVGAYTDVDFQHRTAGLTDGLKFNLTSVDPDVRWVADFDVRGINAGVPSANYHEVDVFNGNVLIGDDQGQGAGNLHVERRLEEFNTPGSFETTAIRFGEDAVGFLTGVTNDPLDQVQYRVEQSATGVGGWGLLTDYGGGVDFTTTAGNDYVRVLVQVNGTAEAMTTGSVGVPHTYTESTSPKVDSLTIGRNSVALVLFDNAVESLAEKKQSVASAQQELLRQTATLNSMILAEAQALSRVMDADYATEVTNLVKEQLITNSAASTLHSFSTGFSKRALALLGSIGRSSPFIF